MAIINKVTKLYPGVGQIIDEQLIQSHIDEQNADGYYLICVDNMSGWYRFFWAKEVVGG